MPRKKKNLNAEPGEISAEERAKLDKEIEANLPEDIPEEENGRGDCPDTEETKPEAEAKYIEVKGEPSFTKIIKERFFHEFNEADLAEINGKIVEELELQKAFAEERAAVAAKIKRSNDEINELLELKEKGVLSKPSSEVALSSPESSLSALAKDKVVERLTVATEK